MALSHSEVSKIVESILAGDKNQFRIIIHEYELMVRSYLATKLYKQDQVDDLAQETFITAYKKLSAFDTEKSIQSWLFGIAHNHLRNYFKPQSAALMPWIIFVSTFFQILTKSLFRPQRMSKMNKWQNYYTVSTSSLIN